MLRISTGADGGIVSVVAVCLFETLRRSCWSTATIVEEAIPLLNANWSTLACVLATTSLASLPTQVYDRLGPCAPKLATASDNWLSNLHWRFTSPACCAPKPRFMRVTFYHDKQRHLLIWRWCHQQFRRHNAGITQDAAVIRWAAARSRQSTTPDDGSAGDANAGRAQPVWEDCNRPDGNRGCLIIARRWFCTRRLHFWI